MIELLELNRNPVFSVRAQRLVAVPFAIKAFQLTLAGEKRILLYKEHNNEFERQCVPMRLPERPK
jgi:hypothetical protein